jgi:hypothetical protein
MAIRSFPKKVLLLPPIKGIRRTPDFQLQNPAFWFIMLAVSGLSPVLSE